MFRQLAEFLGLKSDTQLTTPAQWAELERRREELRWQAYDEPTQMRRAREETENERSGERAAA